jgi:hypothetical protein
MLNVITLKWKLEPRSRIGRTLLHLLINRNHLIFCFMFSIIICYKDAFNLLNYLQVKGFQLTKDIETVRIQQLISLFMLDVFSTRNVLFYEPCKVAMNVIHTYSLLVKKCVLTNFSCSLLSSYRPSFVILTGN